MSKDKALSRGIRIFFRSAILDASMAHSMLWIHHDSLHTGALFYFFTPAYQASHVHPCSDVNKLVLCHCCSFRALSWHKTTVGIMLDWMWCHRFPKVSFDWSTQTNGGGGRVLKNLKLKGILRYSIFLVTLNIVRYSFYDQGPRGKLWRNTKMRLSSSCPPSTTSSEAFLKGFI